MAPFHKLLETPSVSEYFVPYGQSCQPEKKAWDRRIINPGVYLAWLKILLAFVLLIEGDLAEL
jgi:hypothetical protein